MLILAFIIAGVMSAPLEHWLYQGESSTPNYPINTAISGSIDSGAALSTLISDSPAPTVSRPNADNLPSGIDVAKTDDEEGETRSMWTAKSLRESWKQQGKTDDDDDDDDDKKPKQRPTAISISSVATGDETERNQDDELDSAEIKVIVRKSSAETVKTQRDQQINQQTKSSKSVKAGASTIKSNDEKDGSDAKVEAMEKTALMVVSPSLPTLNVRRNNQTVSEMSVNAGLNMTTNSLQGALKNTTVSAQRRNITAADSLVINSDNAEGEYEAKYGKDTGAFSNYWTDDGPQVDAEAEPYRPKRLTTPLDNRASTVNRIKQRDREKSQSEQEADDS